MYILSWVFQNTCGLYLQMTTQVVIRDECVNMQAYNLRKNKQVCTSNTRSFFGRLFALLKWMYLYANSAYPIEDKNADHMRIE